MIQNVLDQMIQGKLSFSCQQRLAPSGLSASGSRVAVYPGSGWRLEPACGGGYAGLRHLVACNPLLADFRHALAALFVEARYLEL